MRPRKKSREYSPPNPARYARLLAIAAGIGLTGLALLQAGSAETFLAAGEAETGTIAGNAAAVSDGSASGGRSIKFGSAGNPGETITAPTALKAFAGGNSIALRWDGSAAGNTGVKQYNIFRNDVQVATVLPGFHADFPEKDGNGYVDMAVSAGQTYSYQVQAVGSSGAATPKSPALSIAHPASTVPVPTVTFDTSAAPDLADWAATTVAPYIKTWYPKIAASLASPAYTPPSAVHIVIDDSLPGKTSTVTEGKLNLNATYYRTNQRAFTNMSFTVTQLIMAAATVTAHGGSYSAGSAAVPEYAPGWVQSGLLNWPAEFMVRSTIPKNIPANSTYTQSLSTSTYFLDWMQRTQNANVLQKLNSSIHSGSFNRTMFHAITGKTVDRMWAEMTGQAVGVAGALTGIKGGCMDVANQSTTDGAKVQWYAECTGGTAQRWTPFYRTDSQSFSLSAVGKCLDAAGSGTADGTKVQSWTCNGGPSQAWRTGPNGSIINLNSEKCLQPANGSAASGTQLELTGCNGTSAQNWTMPRPATAPSAFRAFKGGDNVALIWNVQTNNPHITNYIVYRNGTKVGSTGPAPYVASWQYGTQFTDQAITRGQSYNYQVQAMDNLGGLSPMSTTLSVTPPTATTAVPTVVVDPSVAQITPDLVDWVNKIGVPFIKTWYPKIGDLYARPNYTPQSRIVVKTMPQAEFDARVPGAVAFVPAGSDTMVYSPRGFRNNALQAGSTFVHESVHIMQDDRGDRAMTWLREGQAEYVEAYVMNSYSSPDNIPLSTDPAREHYAVDRYKPAAFLLNYIVKTYDADYLRTVTFQQHDNTIDYRAMQFADGRNIDQVWGAATKSVSRTGPASGVASNKCIDNTDGSLALGSRARLWPCNGATAQKLTVLKDPGFDTYHLLLTGRCLETANGGIANNTLVWMIECTSARTTAGDTAQLWTLRPDGSIASVVAPGKCLEPAGAATADGTSLRIFDCNGGSWQKWRVP